MRLAHRRAIKGIKRPRRRAVLTSRTAAEAKTIAASAQTAAHFVAVGATRTGRSVGRSVCWLQIVHPHPLIHVRQCAERDENGAQAPHNSSRINFLKVAVEQSCAAH